MTCEEAYGTEGRIIFREAVQTLYMNSACSALENER